MPEFDVNQITSLDPAGFAQLVKSASDAQLAEVMSGESRSKVLNEVFRRMPLSFRPERAGNTNAVMHWTITGAPGGGADTYELVIADSACTLSETPSHDPTLTITVGPVDFLKLVSGTANPVMMFMTGKLKAKGDLGLASNIANLFAAPKA